MKKDFNYRVGQILGILFIIALFVAIPFVIYYGSITLLIIIIFAIFGLFTTFNQITGRNKK